MNTEQVPPQYAPDGRWWWDGGQWVPVPVPTRPRRRVPRRALAAAALALVALIVVGVVIGNEAHQVDLDRCATVSPEMAAAIESGSSIPGYQLTHARAVQSHDFQRVYFISAKVSAPGLPDGIGTWASNRPEAGEGVLFAVDDIARASTAGSAGKMSMNDDGAQLSRECVAER